MKRRNLLKATLLSMISFSFAFVPALAPAAGTIVTPVIAVPIGTPTWKPVDFHLFSAPVGTAASGYAEFGETMQAVLPPPFYQPHPNLGVGPGAPHPPPYTADLAHGVSHLGFREGLLFRASEFSNGAGIWLAWMVVPAHGATGSSPDFASGPIIPNALFPIHVFGTDRHNGRPFSVLGDFDVPPLDNSLTPPFNVDGHSHFPIFFADNADFGPAGAKLPGLYEYRIVMLDRLGNGWRIEAAFAMTN
jgi:hypothetical protein